MQKFELKWTNKKDDPLNLDIFLNSKREYRCFSVKSGTVPSEIWDILEKFGDTINIFKLSNTCLKCNEFQRILKTASQIKTLELTTISYLQNLTINQQNLLELSNLYALRLFDSNFQ